MDLASGYRSIRERLTDLAMDLTDDEVATTVLPTPAWTVKDTYAHLVGAIVDVLAGNLDGYGSDAWTAAQVTARSDASLESLCHEWAAAAPDFEQLLADTGMEHVGLVAGSWTHEQDIRGSLGLRGVGDTIGMEATLEQVDRIGRRIDELELPGLRVITATRTWVLGSTEPAATLTVTDYLLARLVYGRRSPGQVLALDWDGEAGPYLAVIGNYGLAARDIHD